MESKQHIKQLSKQSVLATTNHLRTPTAFQTEEVGNVMRRAMKTPATLSTSDVSLLQAAIGNGATTKLAHSQPGPSASIVQRGLLNDAGALVGNAAKSALAWAGDKVNNAASFVENKASDASAWASGKVNEGSAWVKDKAEDASAWAGDKAQNASAWAGDKANDAASWVGDKAEGAAGWVGDKAGDTAEWLGNKAQSAMAVGAGVIGKVENEIANALSEVKEEILGGNAVR